jgi:hypothetical protein
LNAPVPQEKTAKGNLVEKDMRSNTGEALLNSPAVKDIPPKIAIIWVKAHLPDPGYAYCDFTYLNLAKLVTAQVRWGLAKRCQTQ